MFSNLICISVPKKRSPNLIVRQSYSDLTSNLKRSGTGTCVTHQAENVQQHKTLQTPHVKTNNLHRRKQRRRSAVSAKLISAFVFATRIVQFLLYLTPKYQASSHLLCLYRPVCVGPGRKPQRTRSLQED